METLKTPEQLISPTNGKMVIELDSSQLSCFDTCPQKWYYEYLRRLSAQLAEKKVAMNAGTYGHGKLEAYYKLVAAGMDRDEAGKIVEICPDTDKEKDLADDLMRQSVMQRFVMYRHKYSNNDIIPLSPESVEVGFSVPFHETNDRIYILTGRVDLIGTLQGMNCFMDHKFQFRKSDIYSKSIQFRSYGFAINEQIGSTLGPVNMGIVNYIRMAKTIDQETFSRKLITFFPGEHDRWRRILISMFDKVVHFLQSEGWKSYTNKHFSQCDGKYGLCQFTQLCEEYDPSLVEAKINNNFHILPSWSPWREDE
jgi:hypothetical protein